MAGFVGSYRAARAFAARNAKKIVTGVCAGGATLGLSNISRAADVTLPDIGVDVPSMITSFGTKIGLAIGAAVALFFVILVVQKGMKWGRKAG